ncbi:MAG: 3-hydroxyacyl-CoA dehydrogenase NAD-binding domain-containing protein [Syntrophobacteraceae bacterium]
MKKPFESVAVVGTGILGTQIAMLAAYAGYKVCVYDARDGAFDETYAKLYSTLKAKGVDPFIAWDKWEECKKKIRFATKLGDALKDVDLVVEAVTEDVEIKRKVFKQMGENAPAKAFFATNSSSLPISRMEDSSGRPERCLNIHFYFPLQGMNMADLMAGTKTLPEAMQKGEEWVRSLGVVPLRVKKETLGFCFNNVWRAIKRHTLYMWANDFVDFRDIDRAWTIFTGDKEGPFAKMDTVGLDTVFNIEMVYYNESKDPRDKPPNALAEKVKKGELGVKSGKGFYTYPNPEFLEPDFLNPKK